MIGVKSIGHQGPITADDVAAVYGKWITTVHGMLFKICVLTSKSYILNGLCVG